VGTDKRLSVSYKGKTICIMLGIPNKDELD